MTGAGEPSDGAGGAGSGRAAADGLSPPPGGARGPRGVARHLALRPALRRRRAAGPPALGPAARRRRPLAARALGVAAQRPREGPPGQGAGPPPPGHCVAPRGLRGDARAQGAGPKDPSGRPQHVASGRNPRNAFQGASPARRGRRSREATKCEPPPAPPRRAGGSHVVPGRWARSRSPCGRGRLLAGILLQTSHRAPPHARNRSRTSWRKETG